MDTADPAADISEVHLKDYIRILLARRWILVATLLLVVGSVAAWTFTRTPIYRAKGRLVIDPAKFNVTGFDGVYDPTFASLGGGLARRAYYETQYKLIVSRSVMEKTFHEFDFGQTERYRDSRDPVDSFAKLFSVNPVNHSHLVEVAFDWPDPQLAARVLDFVLEEYLSSYRQRALGVTVEGLEQLREKAAELQPKVREQARTLQEFMSEHRMVSLEGSQNIIVATLKELNRSLSEAERTQIENESIVSHIEEILRENRPVEEIPEVVASEAISQLKLEYIRAQQQVTSLSGRFGPNHPEVRAVEARLDTIADKIEEEMRIALATSRANLDRARQSAARFSSQLAEHEQKVLDFNTLASEYRMMQRAYDTLVNTYDAVTKRIEEIEIALATGSTDQSIFVETRPRPPHTIHKPNKKLNLALAGVLGLGLGVALCFFIDYLDTTIKTKEEVERLCNAPALGYVPPLRKDSAKDAEGKAVPLEISSVGNPRSALAESFRSIRTALMFSGDSSETRSYLVTSCSPGEGKTLTSANIAIAFAQAGKKVVYVDADMRKPRMHHIFGTDPRAGLSNYLANQGIDSVMDIIQPFGDVENLSLVSCGPIPPNPAELLSGARTQRLIEDLSGLFDIIVFDTPPLINVTDAAVLSQKVNGVIMVVRSFYTQRDFAKRATETLRRSRSKLLGVVMNNADVPRGGYYAYESYYYQPEYGPDDKEGTKPRRGRKAKKAEATPV